MCASTTPSCWNEQVRMTFGWNCCQVHARMASGVAVASSRLIASRSNALVAAADIERRR